MVKYRKRKENIALPSGGFEEATFTSEHDDPAYIKKRFGFVKLELQHGYDIVSVYCFGKNATYYHFQGAQKLRLKMNSLGIPGMSVSGARFLPWLPKRTEYGLYVVCGDEPMFGTISTLPPLSKCMEITSATRMGKKRARRRSWSCGRVAMAGRKISFKERLYFALHLLSI